MLHALVKLMYAVSGARDVREKCDLTFGIARAEHTSSG